MLAYNIPTSLVHLSIMTDSRTKRALKRCRWLWIGESTLCSKPCMFEHCKQHRAQLRRGAVEPKPCRKCGIGTQSKVQLCVGCGQRAVTLACITTERRARSQYKKVLEEQTSYWRDIHVGCVVIRRHDSETCASCLDQYRIPYSHFRIFKKEIQRLSMISTTDIRGSACQIQSAGNEMHNSSASPT
jgi:hypothetical protein